MDVSRDRKYDRIELIVGCLECDHRKVIDIKDWPKYRCKCGSMAVYVIKMTGRR